MEISTFPTSQLQKWPTNILVQKMTTQMLYSLHTFPNMSEKIRRGKNTRIYEENLRKTKKTVNEVEKLKT